MQRKFLYIRFIAFSSQKLAPGGNQIFNGNNLLKTMAELNSSFNPPPYRVLPIIGRSVLIYKLWHEILDHISKKSRYTLGTKIDLLFIETLELLFIASYLSKQEKLPYLKKSAIKLDLLKFFLQISWETKALDTKKYIALSEPLNEIGKMLGGWIRNVEKETLPQRKGRE